MSVTRLPPIARTDVEAAVWELFDRDPRLFAVAAANAVLFLICLVGVVVDPATVPTSNGIGVESRWAKPAKFAGSLSLLTGTLGWLGSHLPVTDQLRRRVSWTVALGSVVEVVLITGQAVRGVESHFNTSTPLDGAVYGLMGVVIVVVTLALGWLAVETFRGSFAVHPAFASGIQLGLVMLVVGALEGGVMSGLSTNTLADGPRLPVLGWTLTGDFRIAHFVGLHGWQLLPATGYVTARLERRGYLNDGRRLVRAVALASLALFTATLLLAVVALA